MNKLRKLGFLVLALVCTLFVFASCKPEQEGPTAAEAAARISTTQDKQTIVSNFVVNNQVVLEGVTFTVTWESDNAVATVGTEKVDKDGKVAENGAFYLVTINYENNNADQTVKLTATVANGEDKATKTITFTVPKFKTATFEEYAAAAKGDNLTVEGIVTGMNSKSRGDQDNSLYFNSLDNKGGFYAYQLPSDPVTDGIKEGMTVKVSGKKDLYSGTYEIVDPTVTVIDQTIKTVTPVDLTEAYKAAEDLKAAELVGPQALLVTIKGVTITTSEESNGYYKFKLAGKESYIRVSSSNCPLDVEDTKTFKDEFAKHAGWIANATGIVSVYNGAFYLQPVSVDAFEYISLPELTDAEQVAAEKDNLKLSKTTFEEAGELTVDVVGKTWNGVKISWASNSEQAVVNNETGKIAISLGKEKVTVKLTATLTKGEAVATKEFELTVYPAAEDLYIAELFTGTPVAGQAYKLGLAQNHADINKTIYATGEVSGRYLATTTNVANAADFYIEAVTGGFQAYKLVDNVKHYVYLYNNSEDKLSVGFSTTAPTTPWVMDSTLGIIKTTFAQKEYYLGTYKNYTTISASETSFITAENKGVSQFPLAVYLTQKAEYVGKELTTFDATKTYKLGMTQTQAKKVVYLTGEADARYLLSTENVNNAVDFAFEVVTGGYKIYYLKGEAKQYVYAYVNSSSKDAVGYTATATEASVWAYNTTLNMFTTTLGENEVYLGTYNTYLTAGVSKSSYVTAENINVSQFAARCFELELKPVAGTTTPDNPDSGDDEDSETNVPFDTEATYVYGFYNGTNTYYITGEKSGNFGKTTTNVAEAATLKVEAVTNGYYLALAVGGAKKYLNLVEATKDDNSKTVYISFDDTASTTYLWNATYATFTAPMLGTDYYLGTYGTYTTLSASTISFAATSYPAHLYASGVAVGALDLDKQNVKTTLLVTDSIELAAKGAFGSTITWTVKSGTAIVINNGVATVTQPAKGQSDATVVLTATLKCGEATKTVDVTVTVKAIIDTTTAVYEHVFASNQLQQAGGTANLSTLDWTYDAAGYIGFSADKGVQVGSSSKPSSSWTIKTTYTSNISKITINASMGSQGNGKFSIYVGDVLVAENISLTTSATDYSYTLDETLVGGEVKIVMSASAKAMYIKSIKIEA